MDPRKDKAALYPMAYSPDQKLFIHFPLPQIEYPLLHIQHADSCEPGAVCTTPQLTIH